MNATVEKEQLKAVVTLAMISLLQDDVYSGRATPRRPRPFPFGRVSSSGATATSSSGRVVRSGIRRRQ
jgi:hypothetical protein